MAYVASHTNKSMSSWYKFAAWWGGQEGSLLLWAWLLSTYSAIVVFPEPAQVPRHDAVRHRGADGHRRHSFLFLITFRLSPFQVLAAGKGITDVGDGQGLNPLLQYWTMVIHPPHALSRLCRASSCRSPSRWHR